MPVILCWIFGILVSASFANQTLSYSGKVQDSQGNPVHNAVVMFKRSHEILAFERTLTNPNGNFLLQSANSISLGIQPSQFKQNSNWNFILPFDDNITLQSIDVQGNIRHLITMPVQAGPHSLQNPQDVLQQSPQGIYIILLQSTHLTQVLGVLFHDGCSLSSSQPHISSASQQPNLSLQSAESKTGHYLIIRKAGFIPDTLIPTDYSQAFATITLQRDPLEKRIDSVMALMTLTQKIAQMTQPLSEAGATYNGVLYGSVLNGGGGYRSSVFGTLQSGLTGKTPAIPVTYGQDAVHGNGNRPGSTIFPHNIGLGATRDSALVRRAGEVTAKELWAAGIDLNFAPAISVPQDERWGRVYEGFGETPELAVMMGAAMVRGLQGPHYNAPWRVIATAKHFVADGGTTHGVDRGNSEITDAELRAIHLPGYEAVVEQGVLSVMASFNQINGIHCHIDSARLTGILKTELGFDGYIISDWSGIGNSNVPGSTQSYSGGGTSLTKDAVRKAINAGIDLAMEPDQSDEFIAFLTTLVNEGSVSLDRINDAVRRILRSKFRAGRMDSPSGPANYQGKTSLIGSSEHRAIAREAVRKSLVLLKHEHQALPISKTAKIYVFGSHMDDPGYQSGGWTNTWQGLSGDYTGATSVIHGMQAVAQGATFTSNAEDADIVVYVTGESPYAEWNGDNSTLALPLHKASTETKLSNYQAQGKKVITLFMSGRPMPISSLIDVSDAFIAAWLPGSEGAGIADVLFGDYNFTGKLPHTWPESLSQIPINHGDGKTGKYPYGFGLTY